MSCPPVVVLLTLTAIALAMAQTQTPTITTTETPPAMTSCKAITKFNDTIFMEANTFVQNVNDCSSSEENITIAASVLVNLFKTLNTSRHEMANLTDYPDIMKGISDCVGKTTGFNFSESEARKHFGLSSVLVSFKFEMLECQQSLKLADCVEMVYAGHLNPITKRHKNVYMRLFDAIAPFCREAWIRDNKNTGQYCLPSFTLIMSSGLIMILKLFL
ncbi:uncharacterized protein [Choristoneura fumiferana]|uniref:uncharacterized protein n=1 Tax=Choristoneura fumiferana TaxID=7141 RepID=UPI003D15BEF3